MTGYGFQEEVQDGLKFGLNQKAKLIKFEYTDKAGKGNTEGEALDIAFQVGSRTVNYRQFPVTRAFLPNNAGTTEDPNDIHFQAAMMQFNANITHILECFLSKDQIKAALQTKIQSFKQFCDICVSLLPQNFSEIELDLFAHYQWQIKGTNDRTFLELPKRYVKYIVNTTDKDKNPIKPTIRSVGAADWVVPHMEPVGEWVEYKSETGLTYTDGASRSHPFERNDWFMNSPYSRVQKSEGDLSSDNDTGNKTW